MPNYLITGCSRGLGLELVKQLLQSPSSPNGLIIATARSPTTPPQLQALITAAPDRVKYIQLDTTSSASISAAVSLAQRILSGSGLDILINNAAIQTDTPGPTRSMVDLSPILSTNVIAVHDVTSAFLPLLQAGQSKKIINITSTLGSMSMNDTFSFVPTPAYKISKAALNMLSLEYANDLGKEGFTVLAISPGNLKTDLGGHGAELEVDVGARATIKIIEEAGREDNGGFRNIYVEGNEAYQGGFPGW